MIRRSTLEARFEMTPLLDVIFLLLTFFIYSQLIMVRANILPINLPALRTTVAAEDPHIAGITIDLAGQIFYNLKPTSPSQLADTLTQLADDPSRPTVYLAMEQGSSPIDRAPIMLSIIEMLRQTGIEDFAIAAQPSPQPVPDTQAQPEDTP